MKKIKLNIVLSCSILIFIITFALFSFSLNGEFLDWDDSLNFVQNTNYRGLGWSNIKWMFTTFYMNHYQPFSWLTYGLDYTLWGMNTFGYHLTSVVLHSFNAVLFFLISLAVFKYVPELNAGVSAEKKERGNIGISIACGAMLASLCFSLHPLRAESVSWITERRDVLCGFFSLCSMLAYLLRFQKPECNKKLYYASVAFLAAALLSKSMALIVPPLLLLFDFFPLKRFSLENRKISDETKRAIFEKMPFFALALIFALIAYFGAGSDALYGRPPAWYLPSPAKAPYAYGFYLIKALWPAGLVPVYPMPDSWLWPDIISIMFFSAAGFAAWHLRRKHPIFLFALLYYFIALLPVCGMFNGAPQPASDRYTYLPLLSMALLYGYGCAIFIKSFRRNKILPFAAAALVPLLFGAICFFQQKIWSDSETLWLHVLEYNKKCDIAWNNLANVQYQKGNFGAALLYINKALELRPGESPYLCNAGKIYLAAGNSKAALDFFNKALELDFSRYDAAYEAGYIYMADGNKREAEKMFMRALAVNTRSADAMYALGELLLSEGRYEEGKNISEKLCALLPGNDDALVLHAYAIYGLGRHEEAEKICLDVLKRSPENAEAERLVKRSRKNKK